jgi:hypothetical protein
MTRFSKALPKTYPELCAVYLPRAIGNNVALSKALEVINAFKGCKHLNPDQKQYLDDISMDQKAAKDAAWAAATRTLAVRNCRDWPS